MIAFFPTAAGNTAKQWLFTALDILQLPRLALLSRRDQATIVLYHGVIPPRSGEGIFNYRKKFIGPQAFAEQLVWLKRHYVILPLAELVERLAGPGQLPPRALAITFDDGYDNVYTHAFPHLRRLNIPASVFVATDLVQPGKPLWFDRLEYAIGHSRKNSIILPWDGAFREFPLSTLAERCASDQTIRQRIKLLTARAGSKLLEAVENQAGAELAKTFSASPYRGLSWEQIKEMQGSGITIGAHTRSHSILSRLTPAEAEEEITGSYLLLRQRLKDVLDIFAYPNGQPDDFDASTIAILRQNGFRAALSTIPDLAGSARNPYVLPRFTLDNTDDPRLFRLTVTGIRSMLSQLLRPRRALAADEYFETSAESYAKAYGEPTPEGFSFRERKRLTLEMIGPIRDQRVLDIGSGPGVLTEELLEAGASVMAIDIAPAMIELLKARFRHPRLEAQVGNIEALGLPERSCDIAIALGVFEYLSSDQHALGELKRVLKESGRAIASFPNLWSPWRLWNRILLAIFKFPWRAFQALSGHKPHPIQHREYTAAAIRRVARQYGFEITDFAGYNFKLLLFPLDRMFPRLTVAAAERMASLARTRLKFLATGYIVTMKKP